MQRKYRILLFGATLCLALITVLLTRPSNEVSTSKGDSQSFNLEFLEHPPSERAVKAPLLVLMHGYGSNEKDVFKIADRVDGRVLVVSARAPISMQRGSYAWFKLLWGEQGVVGYDTVGADEALSTLNQFIDKLIDKYPIDPKQVYLMGFSQGGMMAYGYGTRYPNKTRGMIVMSGMAMHKKSENSIPNPGLSSFVVHGTEDDVIPIEKAYALRDSLKVHEINTTFREYPMGHVITSPGSLNDALDWFSLELDKE